MLARPAHVFAVVMYSAAPAIPVRSARGAARSTRAATARPTSSTTARSDHAVALRIPRIKDQFQSFSACCVPVIKCRNPDPPHATQRHDFCSPARAASAIRSAVARSIDRAVSRARFRRESTYVSSQHCVDYAFKMGSWVGRGLSERKRGNEEGEEGRGRAGDGRRWMRATIWNGMRLSAPRIDASVLCSRLSSTGSRV